MIDRLRYIYIYDFPYSILNLNFQKIFLLVCKEFKDEQNDI